MVYPLPFGVTWNPLGARMKQSFTSWFRGAASAVGQAAEQIQVRF